MNETISEERGPAEPVHGPSYLSPSSIACFQEDQSEFFLRYMVRVPRPPQTQAMAAGSAFDACIKAYMIVNCCGSYDLVDHVNTTNVRLAGRKVKYGSDYNPVVLDTSCSDHMNLYACLLAESVELHNIPWAYDVGKRIFIDYRASGALSNILDDAVDLQPVDEIMVSVSRSGDVDRDLGPVPTERDAGSLILLGKPDLIYRSKAYNELVVDDWKVNGYCSSRSVSPTPGYVDIFPSRAMHRNCVLEPGGGLSINTMVLPSTYALQLVVYGLMVDASVVGISQLVFDAHGGLRVAKHRYRVSATKVAEMLADAWTVWDVVCSWQVGSAFGNVPSGRCTQLMNQGAVLSDPLVAALSGRGL